MEEKKSGFSVWLVAIGTLLGGLSGIAAVVTVVRDGDNPIARVVMDNRKIAEANSNAISQSNVADAAAEQNAWKAAVDINTPEAYEAYIASFPLGRYVGDAVSRRKLALEFRAWSIALQKNTPESYQIYLSAYPAGSRTEEARQRLEAIRKIRLTEPYSISNLDSINREIVLKAREASRNAESARDRARTRENGFYSYLTDEKIFLTEGFDGFFEGKISALDESWFGSSSCPMTGVWVWAPGDPSLPHQIAEARVEPTEECRGANSFIGVLVFKDGRKYEGEIEHPPFFFMRERQAHPYPHGRGAMWSKEGQLVGFGNWIDGNLQRNRR